MDPHDPNRPDMPLFGMYVGVVIERDDPKKLFRVRVRIPGLIEEGTAWARQLTLGGGTIKRGSTFVPPLGAEVAVWFEQGDVDKPYYVGGNLGLQEQLTGTDGDPDASAIETENYIILIDDRPESKSLTLMDKVSKDVIQMNGVGRGISIRATSQVDIQAKGFIHLNALEVFINGQQCGLGKI